MTRQCGTCTACCTAISVADPELQKESFTPCPHECAQGCSIYATRPASCREFRCLWLDEGLSLKLSPEYTGAIVEAGPLGTRVITVCHLGRWKRRRERVLEELFRGGAQLALVTAKGGDHRSMKSYAPAGMSPADEADLVRRALREMVHLLRGRAATHREGCGCGTC